MKKLFAAILLSTLATSALAVNVIAYKDHGFGEWKERATALNGLIDNLSDNPSAAELQAITDASDGVATPPSSFELASNGITITCAGAAVGDTGEVNGVTYTAVDNAMLQAKIGSNDTAFYESACTSHVTDMNVANSSVGDVFLQRHY